MVTSRGGGATGTVISSGGEQWEGTEGPRRAARKGQEREREREKKKLQAL